MGDDDSPSPFLGSPLSTASDDGGLHHQQPHQEYSPSPSKKRRMRGAGRCVLGIFLLLIVNLVWVSSAEVTRYLFIDLKFKRPFFTTYVKSCMFTVFLLRQCCASAQSPDKGSDKDSTCDTHTDESADDFEVESLTAAEYEPVVLPSDSDTDRDKSPIDTIIDEDEVNELDGFGPYTEKDHFGGVSQSTQTLSEKIKARTRRVKFAVFREVRRFPSSIAFEARLARLSYRRSSAACDECQPLFRYMFMFAPLWFLSSTTYQAALCFDDVSFVTMISSSSSLWVLILSGLNPQRASDRFSFLKLFFVVLNLLGVAVVSEMSGSGLGLVLSLLSAFSYAAFLQCFSSFSGHHKVDRWLLFGSVGVFSVFACTPLILLAHFSRLEPQLPPPTRDEWILVILNAIVGSIFADYLWIWATELTSSLLSSLSLTLSIPLSFIADSLFRATPPTSAQIFSSIPIMASFVGAALLQNARKQSRKKPHVAGDLASNGLEAGNALLPGGAKRAGGGLILQSKLKVMGSRKTVTRSELGGSEERRNLISANDETEDIL